MTTLSRLALGDGCSQKQFDLRKVGDVEHVAFGWPEDIADPHTFLGLLLASFGNLLEVRLAAGEPAGRNRVETALDGAVLLDQPGVLAGEVSRDLLQTVICEIGIHPLTGRGWTLDGPERLGGGGGLFGLIRLRVALLIDVGA